MITDRNTKFKFLLLDFKISFFILKTPIIEVFVSFWLRYCFKTSSLIEDLFSIYLLIFKITINLPRFIRLNPV